MPAADPATADAVLFDEIVDAHYRGLYRFACSLSGNPDTACDLVQQTYYKWAAKGHQLRDRRRVKTWLFTTLHREFLQHLRRDVRLVPLEAPEEMTDERRAVSTDAALTLDTEAVYAALARIDEVFRVPLSLFYLEEFSYAEIAEATGVPLGTVMSRLSRGKEHLRRLVLERGAQGEARIVPLPDGKGVRHG